MQGGAELQQHNPAHGAEIWPLSFVITLTLPPSPAQSWSWSTEDTRQLLHSGSSAGRKWEHLQQSASRCDMHAASTACTHCCWSLPLNPGQ